MLRKLKDIMMTQQQAIFYNYIFYLLRTHIEDNVCFVSLSASLFTQKNST